MRISGAAAGQCWIAWVGMVALIAACSDNPAGGADAGPGASGSGTAGTSTAGRGGQNGAAGMRAGTGGTGTSTTGRAGASGAAGAAGVVAGRSGSSAPAAGSCAASAGCDAEPPPACDGLADGECVDGVCRTGDGCARLRHRQWGSLRGNDANGIALDSAGFIYVASGTLGGLPLHSEVVGTIDAALIKWSPQGELIWALPWGSSGWDNGYDVVVGPGDRIYTVGTVGGELYGTPAVEYPLEWADVGVIEVDGEANVGWSSVVGSQESELPYSMVASGDGSLYVVGYTQGAFDGQTQIGMHDIFITKWSGDGDKLWTRQLGTPQADIAQAAAVDADGFLYVTGIVFAALPDETHGGSSDGFLAKWSPDGDPIWTTQWGGALSDEPSSLALVGDRIYVAGTLDRDTGDPGHTIGHNFDAFLMRFDADGNAEWTREWGGPDADSARAIAAADDGSLFVCGEVDDAPDSGKPTIASDAFLWKWSADGERQWELHWGERSWDRCNELRVTPAGGLVIIGKSDARYPDSLSIEADGPVLTLIDLY